MVLRRRITKNYDEQDVYTGWKHVMCSYKRAGSEKKIKRLTHHRERREGKLEIKSQLKDN